MPAKPNPFINRELSWLAFNRRVLEEALDPSLPLLERLKFLAITGSNLDEFFMVRVGGLQQLNEQGRDAKDPSGLTAAEQLSEVSRIVHELAADQYACLLDDLEPKLAAEGIRRLRINQLTPEQDTYVQALFEHELFPVITPMAVDLDEPFPLLQGLGLNLCVRLKTAKGSDLPRFAVVAIPKGLARFVTVPAAAGYHYLLLEDIVEAFLARLFPGEPILEGVPFRIARNADMNVREDAAGDLLAQMKEVLTERKQSSCVRLEISRRASDVLRGFLKTALDLEEPSVYSLPDPLDLGAYFRLASMPGFDALRPTPWPPQPSPDVPENESIFDAIARRDILLVHPYERFDPVQRLVEEAADDPAVLAIKQILYRTSERSPIVSALARAADRDKHVTAVVELKARFDEARNIEGSTALERAGVQVIYGLKGLKTHAKICIVVRREPAGIRRYIHFGTGNYNEKTARLYSDVSLMTCDEDFGADASAFFNTITGYSQPVKYRKLEAAPIGLRARLVELIENEIERRKQGQPAKIMAKLNSLADTEMIKTLYKASQAGVEIRLNIRGICGLRPGVPELSENISVVSIVDRYLEHARILYFHNGGEPRVFISSADWMPRNLDRRVELLVPVEDPACRNRLVAVLETCFQDTAKARRLLPDGAYQRVEPAERKKAVRSQELLHRLATQAAKAAEKAADTAFVPQRPAASGA
ncbi:MAG: polyphosphate kinase 1 [Verrucomicrobia bacterium A1]|nr:MAG: polyphosphate kinase 1 [Verrucomicrobia bacterium A1]